MSGIEKFAMREELRELKRRIQVLENQLDGKAHSSLSARSTPSPSAPVEAWTSTESPSAQKKDQRNNQRNEKKSDWQAGNLLGVVGGLCFVLAAAFIIKLALDNGWLTPIRQLGLAALLGFALVGAGLQFFRHDKFYLSFLPGTGIVVLFLTTYAASLYHDVLTPETSLGLSVLISIFCLYLFHLLRQSFFVLAAILGTYLAPALLGSFDSMHLERMAFFIIWDIGFVLISVWLRSRLMTLLASYLALFSYMLFWNGDHIQTAWFQLIQFAIFFAGVLGFSIQSKKPLSLQEAWAFGPIALFFYAIEYYLLDRVIPEWTPYLGLGFAALILAGYFIAKSQMQAQRLKSETLILSLVSVIFFHSFYIVLLPSSYQAWFSLIPLAGLPFLIQRSRLLPLTILSVAIVGINFLSLWPLQSIDGVQAVTLGSLYGGALLGFYFFGKTRLRESEPIWTWLLVTAGCLQALVALWRVAHELSESSGSYIATLLWSVFGLAVLIWAYTIRDGLLARVSIGVLLFTAMKGLLYDVSGTDPILRIACFLLLGAVLYLAGFIFRKVQSWA